MPKLTVIQAAAAGWPTRATLYRAIRKGNLSAEKDEIGRIMLDTAELVRVYGEPSHDPVSIQDQRDSRTQAETHAETQEKLAALRAENAQLRDDLADARAVRDRALTLLEAHPPRRSSWWLRVTGRGG